MEITHPTTYSIETQPHGIQCVYICIYIYIYYEDNALFEILIYIYIYLAIDIISDIVLLCFDV